MTARPAQARTSPLAEPAELLLISTDVDLVASLSRAAYQAGYVMATAPTLNHGWQMLKERRFASIAIDCPDISAGLAETVAILKQKSPASRIGVVMGWWDVNAGNIQGAAEFVLYKPLGRRQAVTTLRRIQMVPFQAVSQHPQRVSTPAR